VSLFLTLNDESGTFIDLDGFVITAVIGVPSEAVGSEIIAHTSRVYGEHGIHIDSPLSPAEVRARISAALNTPLH
jgi:hypothetical protein